MPPVIARVVPYLPLWLPSAPLSIPNATTSLCSVAAQHPQCVVVLSLHWATKRPRHKHPSCRFRALHRHRHGRFLPRASRTEPWSRLPCRQAAPPSRERLAVGSPPPVESTPAPSSASARATPCYSPTTPMAASTICPSCPRSSTPPSRRCHGQRDSSQEQHRFNLPEHRDDPMLLSGRRCDHDDLLFGHLTIGPFFEVSLSWTANPGETPPFPTPQIGPLPRPGPPSPLHTNPHRRHRLDGQTAPPRPSIATAMAKTIPCFGMGLMPELAILVS
jgi:hypothetical protein